MTQKMMDSQYQEITFNLPEHTHHYGSNVHLLADPYLLTLLSRLCSPEVEQPILNQLLTSIYQSLLHYVLAREFPQRQVTVATRMQSVHPEEGLYHGPVLDQSTKAISVNLARAGTVPSHLCYDALNYFLTPKLVRQDHISIARKTNSNHKVEGSDVAGHKIGGSVDDSIVLFPDPMGATGSTLVEALNLYKTYGKPKKLIALHCIVTPEYLKNVSSAHPDLIVYAARLDRGLSKPEVLKTPLGKLWNEERGLNAQSYIVPGGGGFGEVLNNAYV